MLLAAAVIPLNVMARQNVLANAAQLAIDLPICAVGLIVARRQPGNPIGWLLLLIPVGILLALDAGPADRLDRLLALIDRGITDVRAHAAEPETTTEE